MSLEALWTAEFATTEDWMNVGVVVLETGRVFGGDGQYYYYGSYNLKDKNMVEARIRATHYNDPQWTAFGTTDSVFDIVLQVVWDGQNEITGYMFHPEAPQSRFHIRMKKREVLP